ncbi:MAG: phosphoserine phosphatase SerB, partial [Geminicoccaceae bacterium]
MAGFVCLIADPARAPLDAELAQSVAEAVKAAPHWLAEAEACEFRVEDEHDASLLARAKSAVAGHAIDVCLVPAASRDVRLLVSDMDSTAITVECIDELADVLGLKGEVARITRRAMDGELDFRAALEARVALLQGLPVSVFEEVYRERVRPMPGVGTLVRTMRARHALTALVSGGFTP